MKSKNINATRDYELNNELLEILNIEANEIASSFEKSRKEGGGTPQEIADRNEGYVCDFMRKYFPYPYRIVKGNVVDSFGRRSNSLDCLILNPSHPYTVDVRSERASIILADGVDYAIEIKSMLNSKKEIYRVLEQIQSVKKLRRVRNGIIFKDRLNSVQQECVNTIPAFIFAEKSYKKIETLLEKISEYYVRNNVPYIEQFDLLLINNRVLIYNFRPNTYVSWENDRALAFYEGGEECLAAFLLEINKIPQSAPQLSEGIIKLYLEKLRPKQLSVINEINRKLQEAGV